MASTRKQKAMVFHQDGPVVPAADHPCTTALKPGKASQGDAEHGLTSEEAELNMHPAREIMRKSGRSSATKPPPSSGRQSDNLPPDCVHKGIKVTLDNNSMWNEFFRCKTEMILTNEGSRMFPYCRFRISGLQPSKKYSLIMDIQPSDNSRYKWTGSRWQVAGKAESHVKSQPFAHPDSPSLGQHWMQSPVSFYKLKLTSNSSGQEGNMVLCPMHWYLPRLHVVQTDKAAKDIKLSGPNIVTFTFPQTEFVAVTAFQNSQFAQLKINYNPFAKGLKEDSSSLRTLPTKSSTGKDLTKDGRTSASEQHPVKKSLKSLLANHKPRNSRTPDTKPSDPGDIQKTSSLDQSAAKVTRESYGSNSRPAQKLFSELIREAHVSLQRCNLEQLGISYQTDCTRFNTSVVTGSCSKALNPTSAETSPSEKAASMMTKVNEDGSCLNPLGCPQTSRMDCRDASQSPVATVSASQESCVDSIQTRQEPVVQDIGVKKHKRPPPLPLPALALFLKRHSSKSKKAQSKPESPTPEVPLDAKEGTPGSDASSVNTSLVTGPPKDLCGEATEPDKEAGQIPPPDGMGSNGPELALGTGQQPSCHLDPDTSAPLDLKAQDQQTVLVLPSENPPLQQEVPGDALMSPGTDLLLCPPGTSTTATTTSPASPILSLPCDTVLAVQNRPHTPPTAASPSLSPDFKPDGLLSDPECSPFCFEPLSPEGSPLTLDLDAAPEHEVTPPEESQLGKDSVFKWHTVLPPPDSYMDASFPNFQPPSRTVRLESPPADPSSQTLPPSSSTPLQDPGSSFQEGEQSLPFPGGLSPLALQLTLSPTFSSLDGDGLSPTPSISELVHFFSSDMELGMGMGVEFPNTEGPPCPPPPTVDSIADDPPQQVQLVPSPKLCRRKKRCRQQKQTKMDVDQNMDNSTYATMHPNLEEVEEQLFISFTSKEALKLHIPDSSQEPEPTTQPPTSPEVQLPLLNEETVAVELVDNHAEMIAAFEKVLLRDVKQMKHRQIIHPVLQEVGLKMNLLDPTLSIDLQYLGVRLPIPPPGSSLEPLTEELPPLPGISAAFVSRTGKTTDVTQIKGWREKFTPSEASSSTASSKSEGSNTDQKKNLSAFCSDMLDEYLENEGKLMDQRASNFSQPPAEPPVYELPAQSSSYVRTLDNVLKKPTTCPPTSDLISTFIPPSKRPRIPFREPKPLRKVDRRLKIHRLNKHKADPTAGPVPAASRPAVQTAAVDSLSNTPRPKKKLLNALLPLAGQNTDSSVSPSLPLSRKRYKRKLLSQTLKPALPGAEMAPLESDSEVDPEASGRRAVMTRALLKQRDLEDGVMWEGQHRTRITEERATIALTSLFTLTGFVTDNPTAPIQLPCRSPPPCLNSFCRLGCICSSLTHSTRSTHCGRERCMFGCSCLKQKVVLLKNLEGSDSSPSHHSAGRRKRKKRMKMAYILKEADSVSQPAEKVRTLWRRSGEDADPEPIHIPIGETEGNSSCARTHSFPRKRRKKAKPQEENKGPSATLKSFSKKRQVKGKKVKPSSPSSGPKDQTVLEQQQATWRLVIMTECQWKSPADRVRLLKKLCKVMALGQLHKPFWCGSYLVSPLSQTVEKNPSGGRDIRHQVVHISRPKHTAAQKQQEGDQRPTEVWQQEVMEEEGPLEYWQEEMTEEEAGPPEYWQQEVTEEEVMEDWQEEVTKEEMMEDWQQEVTEEELLEDCQQEVKVQERSEEKKKMVKTALPFLTGLSPAGFLSANKKQPGGTGHLIQVNGKFYPLAKIQLGGMGALHPANRLAAYLTGRVRSTVKPLSFTTPPSENPPGIQATTLTPPLFSGSTPTSPPTITYVPPTTFAPTINYISTPPPPRPFPLIQVPEPATAGKSKQSYDSSQSEWGEPKLSTSATESSFSSAPPRSPLSSPSSTAQKSSQVFKVLQVSPHGLRSPGPQLPSPPSTQRMILRPVNVESGIRFYRRPDGKLVQLVPVSQLRPPGLVQSAPSPSSMPPAVSPWATGTPGQSDLHSMPPPLPAQLHPGSGLTEKKKLGTLKILTPKNHKTVTCSKSASQPTAAVVPGPDGISLLQPAPVNVISLQPTADQGAELGVKTVVVSAGNGHCKSLSVTDTAQTQPESEVISRLPPAGEGANPEPELAMDPVDLDIICVDDKMVVTTDQEGKEKKVLEVVDLVDSGSSDTDNSSDLGDELNCEKLSVRRRLHSVLERDRREKIMQLLNSLRTEINVGKRMSKVSTLQKAVMVIQDLRMMETRLKKKKVQLTKKRDKMLNYIMCESDGGCSLTGGYLGADWKMMLCSSDKNIDVTTEALEEDPVVRPPAGQSVTCLTAGYEELATLDAFGSLQSALNLGDSTQSQLLEKASLEIQTLQSEKDKLKSLKVDLQQQRDAHIKEISKKSGKSKLQILRKLQNLSSKESRVKKQKLRATSQLLAADLEEGGRASVPQPAEDPVVDGVDMFSVPHIQQVPLPPGPACLPISPTIQPVTSNQRLVQMTPLLAPLPVSHGPTVSRDRPRTIPNILSRGKTQLPLLLPQPVDGNPPTFHAMVPAEVLSLGGAALPGQPVLTVGPLVTGQTLLQTPSPGMASVTLNFPNLTTQQVQLSAVPPPPPPSMVHSSSNSFTHFSASSVNSLLQLVQPLTTQPQPAPPLDCADAVAQVTAEACSSASAHRTDVTEARPVGGEPLQPRKEENLNAVLNELVFLNQHFAAQVLAHPGKEGVEPLGPGHNLGLLQPDLEFEETVTMESEEQGLNGHADQPKGGVLAPPPLLQMKVGGANVPDPATTYVPPVVSAGQHTEGGMGWRPMPRLVPLGLRGAPPS